MTLECDLREPIQEPTENEIRDLIANDERRGDFMILAKSPQVYLQFAGNKPPYVLEYRDGDADQHHRAPDVQDKEELERIFVWYLQSDPRWRVMVHWKKVSV